ncbi:nuclear transport factor 2 family protein [Aquimarina sp. MMG016]|uniref:nuclear transport factor 2 family protein n=1 Tax=Aquimarina sp. MMG016 TaxID=2822690 RepID=UPI001B3A0E00|nr:nuclear transport factor 2 family protein [Aquimarina sp. MMG016]MBQ4821483.1 nuclear transport factor 2 family protein [Aquimarina sp. MMG016]
MPLEETVERFIARVEENKHDSAIEEFYTIDATMQENQLEPRAGRDVLVANEREVLSKVKTLHSKCIRPVFIHGDYVVIRWSFQFDWLNGTTTKIEEITHQRWKGEQIAEEHFFYDSSQLKPKKFTK